MPGPGATTTIFEKCLPLKRTDYDNCSSLTLCNLSPTTSAELDGIYRDGTGAFRIMGALLDADIMAKACQVVENPLYTFIMANAKRWGTKVLNTSKRVKSGLVEVEPFVVVGRKGIINNNYWNLTNGAGANPYTATVTSPSGIPADVTWFPAGLEVYVFGMSSGGSATRTNFVVTNAVLSGNNINLTMTPRNSASHLPAAKLNPPGTSGSPNFGVLMRGVPRVSPAESYCAQIPKINTNQSYLAFLHDTRWSICVDEETMKFRRMLRENNPLYRNYYDVEESTYNKFLLQDFQYRLVNTFLYQKAMPNQTAANWPSLPTISSWSDDAFGNYLTIPGVEGRCVGRQSTSEGVYEQLAECGRVKDAQGQPINWYELREELYTMHRLRKDNGDSSNVIEIFLDSAYRLKFIAGLWKYLNNQFSDHNGEGTITLMGDMESKTTQTGFVYQDFKLDYPAGVVLRVVSHVALDDFLSAHKNASPTIAGSGRQAWLLDWSTISMAIIESRSVELETGNIKDVAKINADAFCRMEMPMRRIKHNTVKFTTLVECPGASLMIENYSDSVLAWTGPYGNYGDLYGGQ